MAISEAQLETWSHQGSVAQSSATYNAIKSVLEATDAPYAGKEYAVFLQGSYGNDTNIYAESDVDIVIRLADCWHRDLTAMPPDQQSAYKATVVDAKYTEADFKRDVLKVLTKKFGTDVEAGDKAIAISANGNRRKADVIVAVQFRRYLKFKTSSDQLFTEGMGFHNSAGALIANYPRQHSANLTRKHQSTNGWLKPMVRVIKNLRSKLVEEGRLKAGTAPSYYLEGLLYNVPNEKFGTSYNDTFVNTFNWIQRDADKSKLVCANEQYYLVFDNSHTSWPKANCELFLNAAIAYWNGK